MIIVKLVVLLAYIKDFCVCQVNYCRICPSHTMCKYNNPGPSISCKGYDKAALLKSSEKVDIVSRINERRHYVAMGFSKLPQAANMRKIHWSEELATFAQRWVDQCDESMRPDRTDLCRDLGEMKVGQNIATIAGPSPGLNVKSFVEIWFMQTLRYSGNVIFYNSSSDFETNYFTQLIWAETESVGCGKARFYISKKHSTVERLVCNFATVGNIDGKTVYSIGIPGTQCPHNMDSDDEFPGLCNYRNIGNVRTLSSPYSPERGLLRILNLSNNSTKQEIDPVGNNLKQIHFGIHNIGDQRPQKTRHAFLNRSHVARKRFPPAPNFWNNPISNTTNHRMLNHPQHRGHSRVFHSHETPSNAYISSHYASNQNFRKYDTAATPVPDSVQDYGKYTQYHKCTRKGAPTIDCYSPNECAQASCTRGHHNEYCNEAIKPCPPITSIPCLHSTQLPSHVMCSCDKHPFTTKPCPISLPCLQLNEHQDRNSDCNHGISNLRKKFGSQDETVNKDERKPSDLHYYDIFPNLGIRSSGDKLPPAGSWNSDTDINLQKGKDLTSNQNQKQVIDANDYQSSSNQDYLYDVFGSSGRKKREDDQINFKPFWRLDNFDPELKAIRYTTLSNKINKYVRNTGMTTKRSMYLEPIILSFSKTAHPDDHVTEKYLSFEELMHLRKLNHDLDNNGRRFADEPALRKPTTTKVAPKSVVTTTKKVAPTTTTKAVTTQTTKTTITTDTPFVRVKHCTRKLTCTWSAATRIDKDGNVILPGTTGGGPGKSIGTRTRPGYVDGCTRTSTCTREFMDRNRFTTASSSTDSQEDACEGDYCERRSLNVHRRNLGNKYSVGNSIYKLQKDIPVSMTETTINESNNK